MKTFKRLHLSSVLIIIIARTMNEGSYCANGNPTINVGRAERICMNPKF